MFRFVLGLTFFLAFFQSNACDLLVRKTAYPFNGQTTHDNLCINDYFDQRELATFSINPDAMQFLMSKSPTSMQYDDMILFNLPNQDGTSLGESGRLALVKNLLAVYFKSLKNEHGSCDLSLYEGTQLLKLENFKLIARTIDGNPGTRLMLTKDDVKNPSWKMLCPNENGIFNVAKSGNYFFIFADVHENVTISTTTTHFSQFLFSFH